MKTNAFFKVLAVSLAVGAVAPCVRAMEANKDDLADMGDSLPADKREETSSAALATKKDVDPDAMAFFKALMAKKSNRVVMDFAEGLSDVNSFVCGGSPLHWAAQWSKDVDLIDFLIKRGADVTAYRQGDGKTPLHVAVDAKHLPIVEALLAARGCDINVQSSKTKETPLHCAARLGHEKMVRYLLIYGADPTIIDMDRQEPSDMAHLRGLYELRDFLNWTKGEYTTDDYKTACILLRDSGFKLKLPNDFNPNVRRIVKALKTCTAPSYGCTIL